MKKVLNSTNFWVTIISIVFGLLYSNGIDIGMTPEQFVSELLGKNTLEIVIFIGVNLYNPIVKIVSKIKNKAWTWDLVYSDNFKTQVGSVISIIVAAYFGDVVAGMVLAVIFNVLNLITHLIINKDGSVRTFN